MRHPDWRSAPLLVAGTVVALGGAAVAGGALLIGAGSHGARVSHAVSPAAPGTTPAASRHAPSATDVITAVQVAPLRRIVPPDLLAVSAQGITSAQLNRIRGLQHVRDLITADGGAIRLESRQIDVLGVDPGSFRSWTPPPTAVNERLWSSLARNEFVVSASLQTRFKLRQGAAYQLAGARQSLLRLGASAALGVPGVDALVSREASGVLGLVPDVAAMINAPGADVPALMKKIRAALGPRSQIIDLDSTAGQLPVDSGVRGGKPTSYLELYKQSAARYCPGLSWTVLAAIGQIESGHGSNDGPSSAGALGPMQFLPSTWQIWGIPGFGDTTADIMNPYDAVPSAARFLCASGAEAGGGSLDQAIYAYNHAGWYVDDVLALAQEYEQQFG